MWSQSRCRFALLQNVAHAHWPPGWLYESACEKCGDLSPTGWSRHSVTIHQQIEVRPGAWRLLGKLPLTGSKAPNHTVEENKTFVERQKPEHTEAISIHMTEQMTAYFHGNIECQAAVVTAAVSTCTFSSIESGCGARTGGPRRAQMTVIICSAKCCFHFLSMAWRCYSALRVCVWNLTFMTVDEGEIENWMLLPVTRRSLLYHLKSRGFSSLAVLHMLTMNVDRPSNDQSFHHQSS